MDKNNNKCSLCGSDKQSPKYNWFCVLSNPPPEKHHTEELDYEQLYKLELLKKDPPPCPYNKSHRRQWCYDWETRYPEEQGRLVKSIRCTNCSYKHFFDQGLGDWDHYNQLC